MPGISFTQEDIISAAELPATWYPLKAQSIVEGPGKSDPSSTTWTCKFLITDGEYKGRVIDYWFSSKMLKNAIRYLKCFGVNVKPGETYPIENTVDQPVQGYLVWDVNQLTMVIKDFKPAGR